jgi:hypothetical protein
MGCAKAAESALIITAAAFPISVEPLLVQVLAPLLLLPAEKLLPLIRSLFSASVACDAAAAAAAAAGGGGERARRLPAAALPVSQQLRSLPPSQLLAGEAAPAASSSVRFACLRNIIR